MSKRTRETPALSRYLAQVLLMLAFAALAVAAAWPIYRSDRLWLIAATISVMAAALLWARTRLGWSPRRILLIAPLIFVLAVVPLAVPAALGGGPRGILLGERDGLVTVVTGWKQLLTLGLPVGEYQAVLVPFFVVLLAAQTGAVLLLGGGPRASSLAVLPLFAPLLFGLIWGGSELSAPVLIPGIGASIPAPREIGLWGMAFILALAWVRVASESGRRAALRRGRGLGGADTAAARRTRGALWRPVAGILLLALAVGAALTAAPVLAEAGERRVPREYIDPDLVVQSQPGPLAGYRIWKRDIEFDRPLFRVSSSGALPERLRIAVLDSFDGSEFHVADGASGGERYTRYPGGIGGEDTVELSVQIEAGYEQIWLPLPAQIAEPPRFRGPRAEALADTFYINRATGSGIVTPVPEDPENGVRDGDGYRVRAVLAAPGAGALGAPAHSGPQIDAEALPELTAWIRAQDQPRDERGLLTLIERLRERGFLSHSITAEEGSSRWIAALAETDGYRFAPSFAGHNGSRLEGLFSDLNRQQRVVGDGQDGAQLVAAVGDDEQFAAAAALIARALGYDSRVVVGVRLGENAGVPGVPACIEECTGENMAAWIEVRGADRNWRSIDATPQHDNIPIELIEGEQLPEFATVPEDLNAQSSDPLLSQGEGEAGEADADRGPSWWLAVWPVLRPILLGMGALLLLLLPVLFLPVAKRIRHRRRRAQGSPEIRALGAWAELLDRQCDAGMAVTAGLPRAAQAEQIGGPRAGQIAAGVDRAVFARGDISESAVDRLWEDTEAELAELDAETTRRERLRRALSPRSLLGGIDPRAMLRGLPSAIRRSARRPHQPTAADTPAD